MTDKGFLLSYDEIISVLECEVLSQGSGREITGAAIDSRETEEGDIFFCASWRKKRWSFLRI